MTNEELFWAKVDRRGEDDCWPWLAGLAGSGSGHGQFWRPANKRSQPEHAHRSSWRINVGPIPRGKCVLHRCDNPPCVNPKHLFLGTRADNMRDMKSKDRQARGCQKPNAKLSDRLVQEMRFLVASGLPQKDVAEAHGISRGLMSEIINRKKWAHVP